MYPITLTRKIEDIEICGMRLGELDHPEFIYPWEIVEWSKQKLAQNAKLKTQKTEFREIKENVFASGDVTVDEFVSFDVSNGIIVIDHGVVIKPFSYIEGPCYIGKKCTILPHSQIRKGTSIGHTCKIAGEVSGTIFQPYSNKAHDGYVGDSYIGSWVNMGAGTNISNLKNTYGPIRVEYPTFTFTPGKKESKVWSKVDTGLQFFGCIMGDYTKAAINTTIYTGKIIGVCAQLFGCILENVGSFVMDTHGGLEVFELDAAIRSQKRMFERRGRKQTQEDIGILKKVFEETKEERRKCTS